MNKDGIWEYPDEYGGMFIDEFILHVLLTDVSDAMIEKYHKVLGERVGVVRFEKAEKSYNELKTQAEDFMTALNKESIPFLEIFVQEEYNRVAVFVDKKEEISAKKLAKRKGFDPSVSVFVAKGEVPTTTANLRGGDGLTLTNGSSFSLGFCGTYNGYKAVISCGHAFSSVGQNVYRVGSSTAIGVSVFRRYPESGFYTSGDLSIIRVTSSDTHTNTVWNPKSPGSGYTSVSGAQYYFTNGQVLHRYGYASGTGYGIVSAVNTCVAYGALDDTSGHYVTNMVRVTNSYNVAIGGDSGGSWVLKGSQNYLCGIQSGKWKTTVNNQVVEYMYFHLIRFIVLLALL